MFKKIWLLALPLALALAFAFPANATVVNFDDLSVTSEGWNYIPLNYLDVNWGDANNPWDVLNQTYYAGYGNTITFPSDAKVGSPDSGFGTITSTTPFNFVGASFSTFAEGNNFSNPNFPDSAHNLKITGYLGGNKVGEVEVDLTTGFLWSSINLGGDVDRLDFSPSSGLAWLMDNFSYSPDCPQVPQPSTLLLLGGGLVGLILLGRRKFTKA